jgi:hypothetical protein
MAPIDREDGRHWCDPASEEPGEDGTWTCPGCETVWRLSEHGVWHKDDEEPPEPPPTPAAAAPEPKRKRTTTKTAKAAESGA